MTYKGIRFEWVLLHNGDPFYKGDILLGSKGKEIYGIATIKDIIEEYGNLPIAKDGQIRGWTNYWVLRPAKHEENEFGEVSP